MLIIEVTDQDSVPDAKAMDHAMVAVALSRKVVGDYVVNVGTATHLSAFRLLVATGEVSPDEAVVRYQGQDYPINEYGVAVNLPLSCLNQIGKLSSKILATAWRKRKSKKATTA
jgi:hypothetical protein